MVSPDSIIMAEVLKIRIKEDIRISQVFRTTEVTVVVGGVVETISKEVVTQNQLANYVASMVIQPLIAIFVLRNLLIILMPQAAATIKEATKAVLQLISLLQNF